jgi:hypothetical protein
VRAAERLVGVLAGDVLPIRLSRNRWLSVPPETIFIAAG